MLHEDSNHDVDKDKLGHEDENDEEHGRDVLIDAAVPQTVLSVIALLPQRVLHDSVPVVAYNYPKGHLFPQVLLCILFHLLQS